MNTCFHYFCLLFFYCYLYKKRSDLRKLTRFFNKKYVVSRQVFQPVLLLLLDKINDRLLNEATKKRPRIGIKSILTNKIALVKMYLCLENSSGPTDKVFFFSKPYNF